MPTTGYTMAKSIATRSHRVARADAAVRPVRTGSLPALRRPPPLPRCRSRGPRSPLHHLVGVVADADDGVRPHRPGVLGLRVHDANLRPIPPGVKRAPAR